LLVVPHELIMIQMNTIISGLILAIATALITSILTYFFTSRTRKAEAILRFREEKYAKLLVLLEGFVGVTASADTKRSFFKEQHESWLYCSDEVAQAVNHMIELVVRSKGANPEPAEGQAAIGSIVMAMRRDLLGKTKLSIGDFKYIDVLDNSTRKGKYSKR
jgi:hypothetical protein